MATNGTDAGLRTGSVGLPTAISATFGLILATTVMVTVPQLYSASTIGLYAMIIALVVMYAQVMSFSELATMIPKAGSMNEYVRAGLGPFFATVTVFVGYFAIVIFPGSSEAFLSATILSDPAFLDLGLTFKWWVTIIVIAIAIVNLLGIRAFAAIEVPLTFLLAASLLIFGVAGLVGVNDPVSGPLPSVPFDWDLLLSLIALATFTFVGVEYTCPLAEELRDPGREIPWGMFIGLSLVAVPMFLWGLAATRYIPLDQLGDPTQITNMNVAIGIFGDLGRWWMGILSVAATISTLNAVTAGVPRIIYGMSQERQLPAILGWLTPGTRAPAIGILLVSIPPIWLNVTEETLEGGFIALILAGVLGWGLAYIIIHISQILLRVREPQARRPYRSPLWPIPQIVGIVVLVIAAINVFPDPEIESDIYRNFGIFLAISIVFSLIYNAVTYGVGTMFKPVPLGEVYRETERIAELLPEEHEAGRG
ncbi:MAG TPA: APC family permease [Actinomycetota bacterium]|nr:APC family permease [Actinomycetota bacterium]